MKSTFLTLVIAFVLVGCSNNDSSELQKKIDTLSTELQTYKDAEKLTEMRLARFDSLDFEFYSNQKWKDFEISHTDDIKVYYPDGHITTGLAPEHIDMLTPMFVFAPNTKIKKHPVRFGSGEWTAVIGEMEGTFSEPMPIGDGKTIPPTGKNFKLSMVTIGKWKDGKMTEEYLFWDNQSFMKQIGLTN